MNSPTHNPRLCKNVRAIWHSDNPRKTLFDSLRADYASEGIFNGKSLDGWDEGSSLQSAAAMRLAYYFPDEASSLIASRLDKLDVRKTGELDDFMQRCRANGARAGEFVGSVAWSESPVIRAALIRLFKRAGEEYVLLAALPGIQDAELIRGRLEPIVAALPAEEDGPYGDGFNLLVALCQRTPKTVRPVIEQYLRNAGIQRCQTAIFLFREVKTDYDTDLLGPLLNDQRVWGSSYSVEAGKDEPRLPVRVCDEAARTLSLNHPELKFKRVGDHANLDKQIKVIQGQLAQKK